MARIISQCALCYIASMGARKAKTARVSVDPATLELLKALARRRHNGDVSALLAEFAESEKKLAAAEALFVKYRIPPLTPEVAAAIDAEWAQLPAPLRKKRRKRAAA